MSKEWNELGFVMTSLFRPEPTNATVKPNHISSFDIPCWIFDICLFRIHYPSESNGEPLPRLPIASA